MASKTTVSVLQEISSRRKFVPKYDVVAEDGEPHQKTFEIIVRIEGSPECIAAIGVASSKNEAKKIAAKEALKLMLPMESLTLTDSERSEMERMVGSQETDHFLDTTVNTVNELAEVTTRLGMNCPTYDCIKTEGPPHAHVFTIQCKVEDFVTTGVSKQKKVGKKKAAAEMLKLIASKSASQCPCDLSLAESANGFSSYSGSRDKTGNSSTSVSTFCNETNANYDISDDDFHSIPSDDEELLEEFSFTDHNMVHNHSTPRKDVEPTEIDAVIVQNSKFSLQAASVSPKRSLDGVLACHGQTIVPKENFQLLQQQYETFCRVNDEPAYFHFP